MSGWKPGGEESPPTGRGLEKRRIIMRESSPLSNIMHIMSTFSRRCTLVLVAMRMIQEAATELVEPKIMMQDDDLTPRKCSSYKKRGSSSLMIKNL